MALDLSGYRSIQTNLFVRLDIPNYQVLTFSDYHKSYTFGGTAYQGLGQLLSIDNTTNNLRASPEELTITIAGIPNSNITDILDNQIKGSKIEVFRAFFNPSTGDLLSIAGNPAGKFRGVINNYSLEDDLDQGSSNGTISLILSATSVIELLNNKVSGRRTNPSDQKEWYPTDLSMDRVPGLAKSNLNFGAPQ
jgi:hypothetical protein